MNAMAHWPTVPGPTAFWLRMLATARPMCDSTATRPSSQITLGKLVYSYHHCYDDVVLSAGGAMTHWYAAVAE